MSTYGKRVLSISYHLYDNLKVQSKQLTSTQLVRPTCTSVICIAKVTERLLIHWVFGSTFQCTTHLHDEDSTGCLGVSRYLGTVNVLWPGQLISLLLLGKRPAEEGNAWNIDDM
jgi:hypothetical protein